MDELALIEAHCRFAAGQVPRASSGCKIALLLLHAFPGACARRLPDVTGMRTEVFETLVRFGLLPAVPSRHTQAGALRLLAAVTPLVEARSERHWAFWLAQSLDPGSTVTERIRSGTPESQRAVRDPGETFSPARSRDYRRERSDREQKVADALKAKESAEQIAAELRAELARVGAERSALRSERDTLVQRLAQLNNELTTLAAAVATADERRATRERAFAEEQDRARRATAGQRDRIAQLERDLAAMTSAKNEANRKNESLRDECDARGRALVDARQATEALQRDLAAAQTERKAAINDASARRAERDDSRRQVKALQARLDAAETDARTDLQARLDKVTQDLARTQCQLDHAHHDLAYTKDDRDEVRESLRQAQVRILALESLIDDQNVRSSRIKADEFACRSRIAELETTLTKTAAEHLKKLTNLTKERDDLKQALSEESTARHGEIEQRQRLTRELSAAQSSRSAVEEKFDLARDRLRHLSAEIAVRQHHAPLREEFVQQEIAKQLRRSRE